MTTQQNSYVRLWNLWNADVIFQQVPTVSVEIIAWLLKEQEPHKSQNL